MRAFVAVTIPATFREALAAQAETVGRQTRDVRWIAPGNVHLTLAFLGEVPAQNADSIRSGMAAAARQQPAFSVGFGSGGTFPRGGEPRIGWVSLTGDLEALRALQAAITREMRQLGIRVDDRPFSPHVTLARIGRQATPSARIALARRFEQIQLDHLGVFTIASIALMESDLTRAGAVYREVLSVDLGGVRSDAGPARRFRLFGQG
ncbi:MAG: RNA 2',3'-cyclic phosphodiesterase [Actinobacteria bacterium]|nr:RNA 2',3'-cyclic phosphodiesterase [Actinomycetota bacterium]